MNLSAVLENGLFALGQVLRLPVMALLWICVAAALFMAGSLVVEYLARRRDRQHFEIEHWLAEPGVLMADADRRGHLPRPHRRMLDAILAGCEANRIDDGGLENILLGHEERVRSSLTVPRMLVKIGPSLGLIGTLIPMGTALAALANGNLEAMSGQMIVAFTTTIIGIATGTIAFVVATTRTVWVQQTIREQRFIAERVAAELSQGG